MSGKIAILGKGESVYAFKAAGVDAFVAESVEKSREKLRLLAKDYAVIFITDDLAKKMDGLIERMNESAYPVIVPLPGENGSNGYAEGKLKERMERALGVDILFGREDK